MQYGTQMPPSFLWLPPASVDPTGAETRVRTRYPDALRESIRARGIRTPLIVEACGNGFRIISGWGRWAFRRGEDALPAFVVDPAQPREAVWDLFLRDNDRWNVVEVARILDALRRLPGLDEARIVAEKLPLLGLHASADLYRRHLKLLTLGPDAQSIVEEAQLPLRRALVLLELSRDAVHSFAASAREHRLTVNELGEALEWIEETAHREGVPPEAIIEEAARAARGLGKDAFRRVLRERRFPRLKTGREALEAAEKELRFTSRVRVEWDAQLERPGIRLSAELADGDALAAFERDLAENALRLRRFLEIV
jgi:hypothetical protein